MITGVSLLAVGTWGLAAHQSRLPASGPPPALLHATAQPEPGRSGPARPAPAASPVTGTRTKRPVAAQPAMPAVLPVGADSVVIPTAGVRAAAQPESVHDGNLGVPSDPAVVGWWMPSTAELVIDGHVDLAGVGPGALFGVRDLHPGAAIIVQTASGAEHWAVDGVRTYQKGRVPAGLFNGQGPRLVIVTCGGPFDGATHHYADNVIAYASPAG